MTNNLLIALTLLTTIWLTNGCASEEEIWEAPNDITQVEVRVVATPLVWEAYQVDEVRIVFRGLDVPSERPLNDISAERRTAPPGDDDEMIAVVFERDDFPRGVKYGHQGAFHWHFTVEILREGELIDSSSVGAKASSGPILVLLPGNYTSCTQDADCGNHFECLKNQCFLRGVFDSAVDACGFIEQCSDNLCAMEYFICDPSLYWF